MARPQALQKLKHDKLLTKQNFPTFVETHNYIVERCENLKGDDDIGGRKGLINVDNTDPEHPIIRCNYDNLEDMVGSQAVPDANLDANVWTGYGVPSQSSVEMRAVTSEDSSQTFLQLYNFQDKNAVLLTSTNISDYNLVLRDIKHSCVTYGNLDPSSLNPSGGGGGTCNCNLIPEYSYGTKIAEWTKDGQNMVSVFTPSDVVQFSGTDGSSTVKADSFTFKSATDSNIVITCSGTTITIAAYYL